MASKEAVVGGLTNRWIEHGSGRPVVLVHGIPTSPRLWRHVIPLVQGRSLAWEMTGYGSSISDGAGLDLGLAAQAERLLGWLDAVGIDRPVLVGHDLGGVAQIAAVSAPDRFSGLVLTNTVSYDSWPIPSVTVMARSAAVLRHMPDIAMYPPSCGCCAVATTIRTLPWSRSVNTGSTTSRTAPPPHSCAR